MSWDWNLPKVVETIGPWTFLSGSVWLGSQDYTIKQPLSPFNWNIESKCKVRDQTVWNRKQQLEKALANSKPLKVRKRLPSNYIITANHHPIVALHRVLNPLGNNNTNNNTSKCCRWSEDLLSLCWKWHKTKRAIYTYSPTHSLTSHSLFQQYLRGKERHLLETLGAQSRHILSSSCTFSDWLTDWLALSAPADFWTWRLPGKPLRSSGFISVRRWMYILVLTMAVQDRKASKRVSRPSIYLSNQALLFKIGMRVCRLIMEILNLGDVCVLRAFRHQIWYD